MTLIGVMHTRAYMHAHCVDDKLDKTSLFPLVKRDIGEGEGEEGRGGGRFVRLIAASTKSYVIATDSSMLLTVVQR